ncbi:unnamed protein product, partial [Polarella glacialis]
MGAVFSAAALAPHCRRPWCPSAIVAAAAAAALGPAATSSAAAASVSSSQAGSLVCRDERWKHLYAVLSEASETEEFVLHTFSPAVNELTRPESFAWFKDNYQECVEGLLSLILYIYLHVEEFRRPSMLELASQAARELNPLALRSGLATWPLFGLLDKLQLVWQGGAHASPLLTEPWRLPPLGCPRRDLSESVHPFQRGLISSPLAAAWGWIEDSSLGSRTDGQAFADEDKSTLRMARYLSPGAVLVDAGVFDGTDWSLMGIMAGATVLGFEPLATNRQLVGERLPAALEKYWALAADDSCRGPSHTLLHVVPGEAIPRTSWEEAQSASSSCS